MMRASRTAGVPQKPSEMMLDEIRTLRVNGEPVPTLEEMLEASRGKVTLLVELKGETADRQMADDAVRIIRERHMTDETIIISLKYNLIEYVATMYPEIKTGYLAFASFGNTAMLNCDYLMLEEEVATDETITNIHHVGKKVFVWTVNDKDDIRRFMRSEADGIITDYVAEAEQIKQELESMTSLERMMEGISNLIF
ncbi:MAG: hypothetical protein IJH96_03470 [Ruminococcus sp.]|nr:hypothetical protein [Ruminococcus sp.]